MNFLPMKQYAEFYASDLAKLGIKFKIEIVDTGTHRSERTSGKYPFFMSANSFFLPGAPVFFYEFFHSDNFGPAGNYQKYKNEKVDRYIELMLNETKKEKRIEYIKLAEKQIMEDCPWVLCHLPQRTEALQPWVHGLEGKLIGVTGMWPSINFGNHEIWVEAEKQKR
jgi:peptide/nickel transport system substrate-binding protein/oligopeptide transport system substrate-binding protein